MDTKYCKCGCGKTVKAWSKRWKRSLEYVHGHNWKGKTRPTRLVPVQIACACGCGEIIDNIRRKKSGSPYRVKFQVGHMWRGKDNHFWQGGKTAQSKSFKQSGEYRRWRKNVFERDNYTCQLCGIRGGVELHPDHIKPFSQYPSLRTVLSNGRTLCAPCHRNTDTYGIKLVHSSRQKTII